MVSRPLRPCSYPGCSALVKSGKCEQHSKQGQQQYDKQRGSFRERGYDYRYEKIRQIKLQRDPLCERCLKFNIVKSATITHHIKRVVEGGAMHDINNLQSVCSACHNAIHQEQGDLWGRSK